MKRYFEGIKFGMLLQFAIGPMCLLVFNTAKNVGLKTALVLIVAIASVDAFYITLASLGASKLLKKKNIQNTVKSIGAVVLVLFGLNIILNAFDIYLIPSINIKPTTTNIFFQGLILALSNPITIVFWGSVLTTKIVKDKLKKKELVIFCIGLVSATFIFQITVAVLSNFLSMFISKELSNLLNIFVGLLIMYFGVKMYIDKE